MEIGSRDCQCLSNYDNIKVLRCYCDCKMPVALVNNWTFVTHTSWRSRSELMCPIQHDVFWLLQGNTSYLVHKSLVSESFSTLRPSKKPEHTEKVIVCRKIVWLTKMTMTADYTVTERTQAWWRNTVEVTKLV